MQVERYRIVLTGWVLTGYRTEDVAVELGKLFKIPKERVWPLLAGEPSIIRHNLTLERAERLRNKIERRGAVCVLKKILRDESECELADQESIGILEPDLNMDLSMMLMHEELLDTRFLKTITRKKRRNSNRRRKLMLVSLSVISGMLVIVIAWSVFKSSDNGSQSKQTPIFTYSPSKDPALPTDNREESKTR